MRRVLLLPLLLVLLAPAPASAEQAGSAELPAQAGWLEAGTLHTCARLAAGVVRCWGSGIDGSLGYGTTAAIGDTEAPGSVDPVDLGPGRTARALSAGGQHTCAVLDTAAVRCWGTGGQGQLGYGSTDDIGDDETPVAAGTVQLGPGRTARAITAGGFHTCALLDTGAVRCWGFANSGQLGYANTDEIGDTETPGSVGTVNLGAGRTARAIAAGGQHTCAVLDTGAVRCWGEGGSGQLGLANTDDVGDTETPGSVPTVDLGTGRTARAITAGDAHTCALLDDATVRCWGNGADGRLGLGNTTTTGDTETPGSVATVDLGTGRTARAITAGDLHTCALLDNGAVRCWGLGDSGRLGYANTATIGDGEAPGSVGPVDLGAGRTARAISGGGSHTCALLDTGVLRCWGDNSTGQLGLANTVLIGDTEAPSAVGPINLGGTVSPAAADLSVAIVPSQPTGAVGDQRTLTVTVANAGSDTATGARVAVRLPPGLRVDTTAFNGELDFASLTWRPPPIAPGASDTLVVTVTLVEGGDQRAEAELLAADRPDPDSTPGNGPRIPVEDDLAAATILVTGTSGAKGTTGTTGAAGATGSSGETGGPGANGGAGPGGTTGAPGAGGAAGPAGAAGRDARVTCRVARSRQKVRVTCRVSVVRARASSTTARLTRRGVLLATGRVVRGRATLAPRRLAPGTYRLRLTTRHADGTRAEHVSRIRVR